MQLAVLELPPGAEAVGDTVVGDAAGGTMVGVGDGRGVRVAVVAVVATEVTAEVTVVAVVVAVWVEVGGLGVREVKA